MGTVSYYCVHRCALLDVVLGHMSPVHTISSVSLRSNFVLSSPLCIPLEVQMCGQFLIQTSLCSGLNFEF